MAGTQQGHHVTDSNNHTKSVGQKLKDVAVGTAKQAAKDLTTAAMIVGPGKLVKGAETAVKAAQVAKKLAPEEKYAIKFAKDIAKTGKPGDVQKTFDSMPKDIKREYSDAARKAREGKVTAQYEQTPRASSEAIRVKSKSTGKTAKINLN